MRRIQRAGIDPALFRSKSWDEFATPGAPHIDLAITVCGNASAEACPVFLGAPVKGHWGLPDPADVTGDEAIIDAAFDAVWHWLDLRVTAFLALPFETLDRPTLRSALREIGALEGAA